MDAGLVVARLAIRLLMAAGAQKLFGWVSGRYGLAGTGGSSSSSASVRESCSRELASSAEVAQADLLLALGFLGLIGP